MSIRNDYKVESIESLYCKEWLLYKHYAKRVPQIIYSFGIYKDKKLEGVCTFGNSASITLSQSISDKYEEIIIELNRLVVNDGLPKNVLSYFVSKSISLLPKPCIVVSFSDANMGHHGYIYQATNFIYTGLTSNNTMLVDKKGQEFHFRNIGHIQAKLTSSINLKKRIADCLSEDLLVAEQ